MELRPADLGGELAVEIIRARVAAANAAQRGGHLRAALARRAGANPPAHLGTVDKWFLSGSDLAGDARNKAAAALAPTRLSMLVGTVAASVGMVMPALAMAAQGDAIGAGVFGACVVGLSAMIGGISLARGRRHVSAPLSSDELADLTVAAADNTLQQDFLRLAREIRQQENIAPEVVPPVRDALRSLGDALGRLPSALGSTASAQSLHQNAASIRTQAAAETDPVTQASLDRQADAVERSAQSAERSALVTKRTVALRAELAAQIESLRLGLTAFDTGSGDVSGLAALSENVRTVAAEAVSVASARAELDAPYSQTASQAQTLTAGR